MTKQFNVIVFFADGRTVTYHRVKKTEDLLRNLAARGKPVKYANEYDAREPRGSNFVRQVKPSL